MVDYVRGFCAHWAIETWEMVMAKLRAHGMELSISKSRSDGGITMTRTAYLSRQYDLIAKARKFFQDSSKLAAHTGYALGSATWFVCECQHSLHRESIFGRAVYYDKD